MKEEIINKVAKSGLITLNLEDYYQEGERFYFDIKNLLHEGIVLKEKDFREFIKSYDWSKHKNQYVAIDCSVDAIIPIWAYMLISKSLAPFAKKIVKGSVDLLEKILFDEAIKKIDLEPFSEKNIIIKGCSNKPVPEYAYVLITQRLTGVCKKIMYGEACSTVPIYKK